MMSAMMSSEGLLRRVDGWPGPTMPSPALPSGSHAYNHCRQKTLESIHEMNGDDILSSRLAIASTFDHLHKRRINIKIET